MMYSILIIITPIVALLFQITYCVDPGKTKEFAQKKFRSKDCKAKSIENIILIGVKTMENMNRGGGVTLLY